MLQQVFNVSLVADIELAVNLDIELAVNLQKQQRVRDDLGGRVPYSMSKIKLWEALYMGGILPKKSGRRFIWEAPAKIKNLGGGLYGRRFYKIKIW